MTDSAAFEPVRRSSDHITVAARRMSRQPASLPGRAGGRLRPSQVPVRDAALGLTGASSLAGGDRPDSPAFILQRRIGNAAVSRMLGQARHQHSAECGHQQTAPAPMQRSAIRDVLGGLGQPLAAPVKEEMQARLGADFSDVRVHTDAAARASAAEVGARAYTFGSHVVIGDGGADGHTLAHELTHVIQQRTGPVAGTDYGNGLKVSNPSDRDERAAEAHAAQVMRTPLSQHGPAAAGTGEQRAPGGPLAGAVLQRILETVPKEAAKPELLERAEQARLEIGWRSRPWPGPRPWPGR